MITDTIRRHLLAIHAEIELITEKERAELIVKTASDNTANLYFEFEMFEGTVSKETEDKTNALIEEDSSLIKENIDKIIAQIVHSSFPNGEYKSDSEPLKEVSEKPVVTFSPAIILRERPPIGFNKTLEDIAEQLKNGENPTGIFADLTDYQNSERIKGEKQDEIRTADSEELFFPKPYNEAQEQIIKKIKYADGVVVQGPPGTGKSHTIANLICHLLATGNRILITAQTSTALKVLRELIPEKMRSLAISLLGNGSEEKKILEESVNSILTESNIYDRNYADKKIKELYRSLGELKEDKIKKNRQLIDIRESETKIQEITGGTYKGTATEIAKRLQAEEKKYSWFKDRIKYVHFGTKFSLSIKKLLWVLKKMRNFADQKEELLKYFEKTISFKNFSGLLSELKKVPESELTALRDTAAYHDLSALPSEVLEAISDKLISFESIKTELFRLNQEWITKEFEKIINGTAEDYGVTEKIADALDVAETTEDIFNKYEVDYPLSVPPQSFYDDAVFLKDFMEQNNKITFWDYLFNKEIRTRRGIFGLKINQRYCRKSVEDLNL